MSMIPVYIKFFGEFRKFGEGVDLNVKQGSSVAEIKQAFAEKLVDAEAGLISSSVLANHNEILDDSFVLENKTTLAILPPVCGG